MRVAQWRQPCVRCTSTSDADTWTQEWTAPRRDVLLHWSRRVVWHPHGRSARAVLCRHHSWIRPSAVVLSVSGFESIICYRTCSGRLRSVCIWLQVHCNAFFLFPLKNGSTRVCTSVVASQSGGRTFGVCFSLFVCSLHLWCEIKGEGDELHFRGLLGSVPWISGRRDERSSG